MTPVLWMRDILAGAEAFTARTSPFLMACILSREVLILFLFSFFFLLGLLATDHIAAWN